MILSADCTCEQGAKLGYNHRYRPVCRLLGSRPLFYFFALFLWSFFLAEGASPSPAIAVDQLVEKPPFKEMLHNFVKSSGIYIAGVQANIEGGNVRNTIFTVYGLKKSDRTVCVNIDSIDGHYEGGVILDAPKHKNVTFRIPDSIIPTLEFPERDLALRVRASDEQGRCRDDDPYLVATWGHPATFKQVSIVINKSERENAWAAWEKGKAISCNEILESDVATMSFDTICQLPVGSICEAGSAVTLWSRGGQFISNPLNMKIQGICP